MLRVLVVDNEPGILSVLSTLLKAEGYDVTPVSDSQKALQIVESDEEYDLLLFDIRMAPVDGMELLRVAKAKRPGTSVIMLTGYATVETAIEALKIGAFDYVTKPFKVDELLITIQRSLDFTRTLAENAELKSQLGSRFGFENIVSESAAMKHVCEMIERVATTDATVLIWGESGTGKELVARAVHSRSRRKDKRFVAVNCAALPETLLESEMFGHVKGSFTGATSNKQGLFEVASGGTIFLDEISGMPMSIQGKLLRVLQEKEVRRVGGSDDIGVDARVLAATNRKLEDLIKEGLFREDLFYRLSVIPIEIQPLRERMEDVLPLAYHVLRQEVPEGQDCPKLDNDTREILTHYSWPGNVRELENAIKHAVTFANGAAISPRFLPARIVDTVAANPLPLSSSPDENFECKPLRLYLRDKEREYVSQVLAYMQGDKSEAAKALHVSLATLYRKLPDPWGR